MQGTATVCECGGLSSVEETRATSGGRLRRRRKCKRCGQTWRTYEKRVSRHPYLDSVAEEVERARVDAVAMLALALPPDPDPR